MSPFPGTGRLGVMGAATAKSSDNFNYAYLHGFASSALSRKGVALREMLRRRGVELRLPDLNVPTFATMTYTSMLEELDRMDAAYGAGRPWRLIGSSLGGYLAARWAELRPRRVDRLLLLCPGFDLAGRWKDVLGASDLERWRASGTHPVPDAAGRLQALHWEFVEDARRHPAYPEPRCPVRIVHGTRDGTIDVAYSKRYAATREGVDLVEVDDDHRLTASIERILEEAADLFELDDAPPR